MAHFYIISWCTLCKEVNPPTATKATGLTRPVLPWLQGLGGTRSAECGTRGWEQMARRLEQLSIPLCGTAARLIQTFHKCCHLSVCFPGAQRDISSASFAEAHPITGLTIKCFRIAMCLLCIINHAYWTRYQNWYIFNLGILRVILKYY